MLYARCAHTPVAHLLHTFAHTPVTSVTPVTQEFHVLDYGWAKGHITYGAGLMVETTHYDRHDPGPPDFTKWGAYMGHGGDTYGFLSEQVGYGGWVGVVLGGLWRSSIASASLLPSTSYFLPFVSSLLFSSLRQHLHPAILPNPSIPHLFTPSLHAISPRHLSTHLCRA